MDDSGLREKVAEIVRDSARFGMPDVAVDRILSLIAAEKARGHDIAHTIGDNDLLYKQYGIQGSTHIAETEQLCEVIRSFEARGPDPLLVQAREALRDLRDKVRTAGEHPQRRGEWEDVADALRVADAALDARLGVKP